MLVCPSSNIPDIVIRAQAGDRQAFEQLYRQNLGRVHALCLRLTADPLWADELTQQVFIRAWQRLTSFEGRSAFSTWLHRLTVNHVMGQQRSLRRRRSAQRDLPIRLSVVSGPETALDLEQAIATLPPRARLVFVLHDVEGWSHPEIAREAGIAVGTSKAQLHRARHLLREVLRP